MKCKYCGEEIPDDAKYCSNCGRPTGVAEATPISSPSPKPSGEIPNPQAITLLGTAVASLLNILFYALPQVSYQTHGVMPWLLPGALIALLQGYWMGDIEWGLRVSVVTAILTSTIYAAVLTLGGVEGMEAAWSLVGWLVWLGYMILLSIVMGLFGALGAYMRKWKW